MLARTQTRSPDAGTEPLLLSRHWRGFWVRPAEAAREEAVPTGVAAAAEGAAVDATERWHRKPLPQL